MAEPLQQEHKPFVPQHVEMREFTVGTVVLGLVMTVVLGAANAYLGLKAGQTIAATYPAAVISMAWLRLRRWTPGRGASDPRPWRAGPGIRRALQAPTR